MLPECVLIVGPSGCGKTYTLLNHILQPGVYNYIFIICPTLSINETYNEWVGLSDRCVFGVEINPEKLEIVLNFIISKFSGDKSAIIIDNMSNSSEQH